MKIFWGIICFVFLGSASHAQLLINWQDGKAISADFDIRSNDLTGFTVSLDHSNQAIFGKWSQVNGHLNFKPVVPFTPGLTYQLKKDGKVISSFIVPEHKGKRTKIVGIYPSGDSLPENLLKIHIHFSAPMGEQYSENFIRVLNGEGVQLPNIFLPLQPELWDKSRQILTLWLDPGRIKRDLGPNRHWGQPLSEGQQYTIDISGDWKDQQHVTLEGPFKKTFVAVKADRLRPQIKLWEIVTPQSGTLDRIQIKFREALDHTLGFECLSIRKDGKQIEGEIELDSQEQNWLFTPKRVWEIGSYEIKIESRLEDLAGNNLRRLFDKDLKDANQEEMELENYYLPFEVR